MAWSDIKLGLKRWMHGELKFTVIFGDKAAPRPRKKPYAVLILGTEVSLGDEQRGLDSSDLMEVYTQKQLEVSLEILGTGALEKMSDLQDSLGKQNVLDTLYNDYGLSVVSVGDIQNLTIPLETDFEERAQMDIEVGYASKITDDVGKISFVKITPKINGDTRPEYTVTLPPGT